MKSFNARAMQEAFNAKCEQMTPRVRPFLEIIPFEEPMSSWRTCPRCRSRTNRASSHQGRYQGSYIRTGDGDRKLTQYEIDRLMEEHGQPTFDDEIVPQATLDDLDPNLLSQFIARQRELHPRIFGTRDDENIAISMHVAKKDDAGTIRPTLGGLLALGSFPNSSFRGSISPSPLFQASPKPKRWTRTADSSTRRPSSVRFLS